MEAAAACRGRTCWITSVCSCAAGNCWAMCMSPEKPVVQPLGFRKWWRSPLEPGPFGGPGKHSRHFQIRLRHCYRRSSSAAESSSPEAPGHPPMQRSTSGHREERQGYCWYGPCRVPSTFHWQLNWLRSAKGVMVP